MNAAIVPVTLALNIRRPSAWVAADADGCAPKVAATYSPQDIAEWRADFGFARRQHSLARFGYTDEELLEWRRPFDELASAQGIDFSAFETFVARKYSLVIPEEQLAQKVQFFWQQFDKDGNNFIDFGEFIVAGFLFDVASVKEAIRKEGVQKVFEHYAVEGFISDAEMWQLMLDFRFFVSTATDVRKLMSVADMDTDGLVGESDFLQWVESEDTGELNKKSIKRGGKSEGQSRRTVPPPVPDDDDDE